MKKISLLLTLLLVGLIQIHAEVKPGDKAVAFSLKNVDGKQVSLADYQGQKGVILVFTCNPCPFANAYEQRIIALHQKYAAQGYPVVAINPNDEALSPEDSFDHMVTRANERKYPFPYLKDESQEVYKAYGATKTPHIFLLVKEGKDFKVAYIGAIDDNAMDAASVGSRYLEDAIAALMKGESPKTTSTKAIGCTIKTQT